MSARSLLRVFASLFALLAVSNLLKPLQWGEDIGFVLLGKRLSGTANLVAGPLFGIYLAVYARALWRLEPYALPMGAAYAAYVALNLVLFPLRMPAASQPSLAFSAVYAAVALGVSVGAVVLLARLRKRPA